MAVDPHATAGSQPRRALRVDTRAATTSKRALLLLCSTALVVLVLELAVRLFFGADVDIRKLRADKERFQTTSVTRASRHPQLIAELQPGIDVVWKGNRIVTDGEGFSRIDPEHPAAREPAVRVALIGDSTAFGWGVDYRDSYGAVLERELTRALGTPVHVRNFAVPGYDSYHNRVTFEQRALPWNPDLVLLHYDPNDANKTHTDPYGYMEPDFGDNALDSALLKFAARRFYVAKTHYFRTVVFAKEDEPNRYFQTFWVGGPQYDAHVKDLQTLANIASSRRIPVVALLYDAWLQRSEHPERDGFYLQVHRPMTEHLSKAGVIVVDTYTAMQRLMRERDWPDLAPLWVFRGDPHFDVEGHRMCAALLFEPVLRALERQRAASPPHP
jgi:hypothetical protein